MPHAGADFRRSADPVPCAETNFVIAWIVFDSQFRAESLVYCRIIGRCHFEGFKSQFLLEFKCKLLFLLKLFKHTRIVGYVGNNATW